MSDYTKQQVDKLLGYQTEFGNYIQSIIDFGTTFKQNEVTKFNKLSPEEQELKRPSYETSIAFYDNRLRIMNEVLEHFNRIIENIKSISLDTEYAIKVHTAINVVKDQFPIEEGKETPSQIKEAYNADVAKRDGNQVELDSLVSDIAKFVALLEKNGLLYAKVGKTTILGIVEALQNIALEMSRTHSVDDKLKEEITPKASLSTQEDMRTLEEYDKKIADGDMVHISKVAPKIVFVRSRFTPTRVMITGAKTRAALEGISSLEKQIDAIDRALAIINNSASYRNTYMLLIALRSKLESRLNREKSNFDQKELGVISEALGKTDHDDVIEAYAEMYAELQATIEDTPDKADKIIKLRSKLDQFANNEQMSSEDILSAITLGRKYNDERKKASQAADPIMIRLTYRDKVMESLRDTLEQKVLDELKQKGLIRPEATIEDLSNQERILFDRHLRLEEATTDALKKFRGAKAVYDRISTMHRQSRLSSGYSKGLKR